MINLARRSFLFGASAALVVPPVRTFHLMPSAARWGYTVEEVGSLINWPDSNVLRGIVFNYIITPITPSAENGWCENKITPVVKEIEV